MMYMLDTNIIIYLMKNKPPIVREKINQMTKTHELCMSFVSYAELLKGVQGSENPQKAQANLERITQYINVVYADKATCEYYGKWASLLKKQGMPIGNNDLWIACHALASNAIIVTHNNREFARITDLLVEDWTV